MTGGYVIDASCHLCVLEHCSVALNLVCDPSIRVMAVGWEQIRESL